MQMMIRFTSSNSKFNSAGPSATAASWRPTRRFAASDSDSGVISALTSRARRDYREGRWGAWGARPSEAPVPSSLNKELATTPRDSRPITPRDYHPSKDGMAEREGFVEGEVNEDMKAIEDEAEDIDDKTDGTADKEADDDGEADDDEEADDEEASYDAWNV